MRRTYEAGKVESRLCIPEIVEILDEDEKKSVTNSDRSLSRSTQTSLSLPGVKQVVLRSDGVHWVSEIDSPKCKSPDEVSSFSLSNLWNSGNAVSRDGVQSPCMRADRRQ